jgi:alpha-beta hydrolase superfamily lysophospholipase
MPDVDLLRVPAVENGVTVLRYHARRRRGVSIVAGHGYSSSKHNLDFLCVFLASHGFDVFSLDFPGHKLGASGGVLRGVDDCIASMSSVARYAREHEAEAPIYAMGHSMGGMTALFTTALDPDISGCIAIATGFGRPTSLDAFRQAGATDFRSSYVDGVTLPELVAGVDRRYDELLPKLAGRPVLYIAADRDAMVSPSSVRELYDRAPEPKTYVTIESDHTYAGERSRAAVLQWLDGRHPRS